MCQIDEQRDQECALKRINVKKSVDSKIKYFRRVRVQTENTSGTWDENKIYFKYMPKNVEKIVYTRVGVHSIHRKGIKCKRD